MKESISTIYLVRHAQAQTPVLGLSKATLTNQGVEEAKERAKEFANIKFDVVFSSDYERAIQTAEIMMSGRGFNILTSEAIRERNYRSLNGHAFEEVSKRIKEASEGLTDEEKMRFKLSNEESVNEVATRLTAFIEDTTAKYPGKTMLVVTHGAILRAFLIKNGFAKFDELPGSAIKNTGYVVVETDGVSSNLIKTEGVIKN